MKDILNFFQNAVYAFTSIGISDIVDILVVTFLFYKGFNLIRSTSASRIARAVIVLLALTWISGLLDLYVFNFILSNILELGFIAVVILFQPELRRALDRFGGQQLRSMIGTPKPQVGQMEEAIMATVSACEIMSKEHVGVLLVFERKTSLEEFFRTGTMVDAKTTEQLLRNLFFPKASLHDGAVIVRSGRVAAAGCVMPLSENPNLNSDLGTRHRAGIGTSEASDAVVVIVSEETGTISVAIGGMLKRHLAPQTLERLLRHELIPAVQERQTFFDRIKQSLTKKDHTDAR